MNSPLELVVNRPNESVDKNLDEEFENAVLSHLSDLAKQLFEHGLNIDLKKIHQIKVHRVEKGNCGVRIAESGDVVITLVVASLDDLHKVEHEIGHALHYLASGRRESIQGSIAELSHDGLPSIQQVADYLRLQAVTETVAYLTEVFFKAEKIDSSLEIFNRDKKIAEGKYPAFELYYTNPKRALAVQFMEIIAERLSAKEERLKFLATIMNASLEEALRLIISFIGGEFEALDEEFKKSAEGYYHNSY